MVHEPGWKQCSHRWVLLPARTMGSDRGSDQGSDQGSDRGSRVRALRALCVSVVSSHLVAGSLSCSRSFTISLPYPVLPLYVRSRHSHPSTLPQPCHPLPTACHPSAHVSCDHGVKHTLGSFLSHPLPPLTTLSPMH